MVTKKRRTKRTPSIPWVCPHCYAVIAPAGSQEQARTLYFAHLATVHSSKQPAVGAQGSPTKSSGDFSRGKELVKCPHCAAEVRSDRIEKHVVKVHASKRGKWKPRTSDDWLFSENRAHHRLPPPRHPQPLNSEKKWEWDMTTPKTKFWRTGKHE
jgi:hypothetical protein